MTREVHPIENRSYEILRSSVDTSALPPYTRAVVERVVHASADLDYVTDLVCDEAVLVAAAEALHRGAPVVADVTMVAAGITGREVVCRLPQARADGGVRTQGDGGVRTQGDGGVRTRSARGIALAFREVGPGAVWVIGCAPTALDEVIALDVRPALVVGLPVGFVGAAESKARLRGSGLPAVSNVSAKGGSAVAAAVVNALLYVHVRGVP